VTLGPLGDSNRGLTACFNCGREMPENRGAYLELAGEGGEVVKWWLCLPCHYLYRDRAAQVAREWWDSRRGRSS
jgi:hypothetical protein